MKLLITGGTGFFGRSLLRYLNLNLTSACNKNVKSIVVLTRNPDNFLLLYPEFRGIDGLEFFQGDICMPSTLPWKKHFTHVIHAAADSTDTFKLSNIDRYKQIVDGTENILKLAVATGVSRFLLTSSGGVYGRQPLDFEKIPETYCGMPESTVADNVYGIAKRQAELLCALYAEQFKFACLIARCFAFVGPDLPLNKHFAIGNFILDAINKNKIIVSGDGTPLRSYLYQDDLAKWLITILEDGKAGEAYNVGSDQPISIADLARLVRDVLAPNKEVIISGQINGYQERNRYIPNIDKVKNQLNLSVERSLVESIKLTSTSLTK